MGGVRFPPMGIDTLFLSYALVTSEEVQYSHMAVMNMAMNLIKINYNRICVGIAIGMCVCQTSSRLHQRIYCFLNYDNVLIYTQHYSGSGRQLIAALNAGSNITGVLTDTDKFSALLHSYGALAFWDYAAAAPYVNIDMNSTNMEGAYKDGVYFSMHKFVGGAGTPGE